MTHGYRLKILFEAWVEVLKPMVDLDTGRSLGSFCLFPFGGDDARTFDGRSWVKMEMLGETGARASEQLSVPVTETEDFFLRALGSWDSSSRFLVHISCCDMKIGIWSAPGMDFMPLSTGIGRVVANLNGYEEELARQLSEAVMSVMVMES